LTAVLAPDLVRRHVIQGTFEATDDCNVVLSTILGSCVAACLRDPSTGVGGMNHFLLPEAPGAGAADRRYGVQAMELLINRLLAMGAGRHRLEAKIFGGARMTAGLADIGARNIAFAHRFLADEQIPIISESVGGDRARKIKYWPALGRAQQQFVAPSSRLEEVERQATVQAVVPGDVELFG
jgi:chemotaxis protein CheD